MPGAPSPMCHPQTCLLIKIEGTCHGLAAMPYASSAQRTPSGTLQFQSCWYFSCSILCMLMERLNFSSCLLLICCFVFFMINWRIWRLVSGCTDLSFILLGFQNQNSIVDPTSCWPCWFCQAAAGSSGGCVKASCPLRWAFAMDGAGYWLRVLFLSQGLSPRRLVFGSYWYRKSTNLLLAMLLTFHS